MSETPKDGAGKRAPDARTDDPTIAGLVEQLVEVGGATRDCATILTALIGELRKLVAVSPDGGPPVPPIAPDVLEIILQQAQAAGMSVDDYLRDALTHRPTGDAAERARAARRAAVRAKAESRAVRGQSAQALAHAHAIISSSGRDGTGRAS
jgi:hypothetical protein